MVQFMFDYILKFIWMKYRKQNEWDDKHGIA